MKDKQHGGKRERSGRKAKYGEQTKPVRIPLSKVEAVYEFIRTGKITTIHPMP